MPVIAQHLPPPQESLTMLLGIAAILLVVGWTVTRIHRDRQRFALMRAALEKGVTRFPGTPPFWLVSLRQGVTLVTVGFGLTVIGVGAWWMVRGTPMPSQQTSAAQSPAGPEALAGGDSARPLPPPPAAREDEPGPDNDGRPGPPPQLRGGQHPRPDDGPPGMDEQARHEHLAGRGSHGERDGAGPHPRPAPPGDPQMERWHWAQAQQTVGLVSAGVGMVLMLLGLVRIGFARIEQHYVSQSDPIQSP